MSDDESKAVRRYSPKDAAAALRRAATLQADAADEIQRRVSDEGGAVGPGYADDELRAAAREVGIEGRFVAIALAELDGGAVAPTAQSDRDESRTLVRWLGTSQRSVVVSRVIEGTPTTVWAGLRQSFELPTVGLRLQNVVGGEPDSGGIAVFAMPTLSRMATEHGRYSALCYQMEVLELRKLEVELCDLGGRTRVSIYGDLRAGAHVNVRWARRVSAGFGTILGGGGLLAASALGVLAATGLGALGVLVGAGGTVAAWRFSYRRALEKLHAELDLLLADVDMQRYRTEASPSALAPAEPA